MNRGLVIGVVVVLLLAVGGGIWFISSQPSATSQGNTNPVPSQAPADASSAADMTADEATGNIVEFTVEGSPFKFEPAVLKVKKGDTVRINFKNTEGFHDLVIDEFDVATNKIGEGEEEEVEFVVDKVGSFEYYCSVEDHREMGMVGTLIVE